MSLIPYRRNPGAANYFDPFRMMEEMEREFFGDRKSGSFNTDIRETETEYVLEADLPGFKKEDIHVDISDDTLTISAERHSRHEDKEQKARMNFIMYELRHVHGGVPGGGVLRLRPPSHLRPRATQ